MSSFDYIKVFSKTLIIAEENDLISNISLAPTIVEPSPSKITTFIKNEILNFLKTGELNSQMLFEMCDHEKLTPFQKIVFSKLIQLKNKDITTYKKLSLQCFNSPNYARSIGQTLNKNPFLIIVPCHKVLSEKNTGGYVLGLDFKQKLIKLSS